MLKKEKKALHRAVRSYDDKPLRLGATGTAARNGFANLTRPGNVAFDAAITVFEETKAGFKGLEEDPKTRRKEGNRPGDEHQEKDPKESKARVVTGHLEESFWLK